MRSTFQAFAFAAGVSLAAWSCGGYSSPSSAPAPTTPTPTPTPSPSTPQGTVTVSIIGSSGSAAFSPNPVSASAGDAVAFKNNDTTVHHIVLDDGSADLGSVGPNGTSASVTVKSTGQIRFHCLNHPSMVGTINGSNTNQPPPSPGDPSPY